MVWVKAFDETIANEGRLVGAAVESDMRQAIGDKCLVAPNVEEVRVERVIVDLQVAGCLLYTSPSPRD